MPDLQDEHVLCLWHMVPLSQTWNSDDVGEWMENVLLLVFEEWKECVIFHVLLLDGLSFFHV